MAVLMLLTIGCAKHPTPEPPSVPKSETTTTAIAEPQSWYDSRPGDSQPLLIAHQGGEDEAPSNTKEAFDQAVKASADVLDTDLFMTKDGVLVFNHDETLDRTTNGTGPIVDKTYQELLQLDFAYNWSPDQGQTYPWRGKGVKVMRLEDFFDSYPSLRYGIEIKQVGPEAVTKFCQVIRQSHKERQVLVSSFAQANMDLFRQQCPEVATSATLDEAKDFYLKGKAYDHPPFSSLQIPETYSGITVVTQAFVNAVHAHPSKLKLYVWTIKTVEEWKRFASLGVDGILVDNPQAIARAQ
jgi:glycerophosphoryl diester phosphodiesterase